MGLDARRSKSPRPAASPIPLLAPVTRATAPSSRFVIASSYSVGVVPGHAAARHLSLPRTPDFLAAKLVTADTAEQIRQTEGGH